MVDVAHLYEDAHLRKAHIETLLILCSNHNQAQRRAPSLQNPPIELIFAPAMLRSIGENCYLAGNFPRSYAANRLAAYYFEKQNLLSDAVESLVDAISGTRAYRWAGALCATVREIHRLNQTGEIAPIVRWQFLSRFSIALYDYCRWDTAAKVAASAQRIAKRIGPDQRNPQRLKFEKDLAFRHGALVRGLTQTLTKGESTRLLIDRLVSDAKFFRSIKDFKGHSTNLDIASRLLNEILKESRKAHTFSEEALSAENKISNTWVLQELLWRQASFFHSQKDSRKTLRCVVAALAEHSKHPVILEPIADSSGPRTRSLTSSIKQLGLTFEVLADNGASFRSETVAEPLRLTDAEVDSILNTALR